LEPAVHGLPRERDVAAEVRIGVAPRGVLGDGVAGVGGPEHRVAAVGLRDRVRTVAQEVRAHVGVGKRVDGNGAPRLPHEDRRGAVGERFAVELGADALRRGLVAQVAGKGRGDPGRHRPILTRAGPVQHGNWTFLAAKMRPSGAFVPCDLQDGRVLRRRHRRVPDDPTGDVAPPAISSAVARFVAGSLVAVLVVAIGGYFALRNITITDAERGTEQLVQIDGRLVQSSLRDPLLKRDPKAIARVDDTVVSQVLPELSSKDNNVPPIKRVKIWAADGTVLYSDVPQLIGKKYTLGAEEREILEKGGAEAELSDLSKPENRYERQFDKL